MTYFEITKGDARESLDESPVFAPKQPHDHVHAVHVVVSAHKDVQHENLAYSIECIEELDEEIGDGEVVAVPLAADEKAVARDELLEAHAAAGAVVALRQQVPVDLVDEVAHRFVAHLRIGGALADARHVHQTRHVDAGAHVEETPDHRRREGDERLAQQQHGHPLVVGDGRLPPLQIHGIRDLVVKRKVVVVGNPADVVRVLPEVEMAR